MLYIYLASLPISGVIPSEPLCPPERQLEVEAVGDPLTKAQKYFVWRLLDYALQNSIGLDTSAVGLYRSENGKWCTTCCEISLSHSKNALAVAVSDRPVGVDIELIAPPRSARFAARVLTPGELAELEALPDDRRTEFLISRWTAKESIYKRICREPFVPSVTVSDPRTEHTRRVNIGGRDFALSVSCESLDGLTVFTSEIF
jgi:phosphopantetheinyl transferase (holo-ACP synthase)